MKKKGPIFPGYLLGLILVFLGCSNEKPERKLIGDWEIINSTLMVKDSPIMVHQTATLGTLSLKKTKTNEPNLDLNEGSWSIVNFPDSIIAATGHLSWTSTETGDFNKIPWNINLIFSTTYIKDFPVKGTGYFNVYQGNFLVTEIQKKSHYQFEGSIFKPNYTNGVSDPIRYAWKFEIKRP